jgi:hypothetical protein
MLTSSRQWFYTPHSIKMTQPARYAIPAETTRRDGRAKELSPERRRSRDRRSRSRSRSRDRRSRSRSRSRDRRSRSRSRSRDRDRHGKDKGDLRRSGDAKEKRASRSSERKKRRRDDSASGSSEYVHPLFGQLWPFPGQDLILSPWIDCNRTQLGLERGRKKAQEEEGEEGQVQVFLEKGRQGQERQEGQEGPQAAAQEATTQLFVRFRL